MVDYLTMADVAGRMQIPVSTLYQYVAELERDHPDVRWYSKHGRHRRFTETQYKRLGEAIWGSSSSRQESARATASISSVAATGAGNTRAARTRQTKLLRASIGANSSDSSNLVRLRSERLRHSRKRPINT